MDAVEVQRIALWAAIQDYAGLWEIAWELQGREADADPVVQAQQAREAVRELVGHGWVELYRCPEPDGDVSKVPPGEVAVVLADDSSWEEPGRDAVSIRMSATQAGEAAYAATGQ